jgi:hypothetical protein
LIPAADCVELFVELFVELSAFRTWCCRRKEECFHFSPGNDTTETDLALNELATEQPEKCAQILLSRNG